MERSDNCHALARPLPQRAPRRRQQLEAKYGSDAALGARYDDDENLTVLPNGTTAARCTNYALLIRSLEPNTAVWGFSGDANPESEIGQIFFGQDFAVVDGRYIVDPWVVERAGMSERCVFDLEDPADAAEIRRLYGDRSKWKQMYPPLRVDSREDRVEHRPSTEYRGRVSALPPRLLRDPRPGHLLPSADQTG